MRTIATMLVIAAVLGSIGQVAPSNHGTEIPARTIVVDGTNLEIEVSPDTSSYRFLEDGEPVGEPRSTSYEIMLRHGSFDPLAGGIAHAPPVHRELTAGADTHMHIVQFVTQPLPAYRAAIAARGGIVRAYLPFHCHLVEIADVDAEALIGELPYVRWVGPYHPAYRLEPAVLAGLDDADGVPAQRYSILVAEGDQRDVVATAVAAHDGTVDLARAGRRLVHATLDRAGLIAVLRLDAVLYIDRWSPLESDMDVVREATGANFIETVAGFTGTGVRGEVMDAGFNLFHVDFSSRPLIQHTAVGSDEHGAATSGIVFGDGAGDPTARGMLPDGQGIVASSATLEGVARYDHISELPGFEVVFHSASVGSERTVEYTTVSADLDEALFDFDVLHVQSQSNAGTRESRPQAWAKNIVSVGGVLHQNTLDRSDDRWDSGASFGPASDGRIKPDLCHFYDSIRTVSAGTTVSYTSAFGGTSAATPIVAGHFGLFFQMWQESVFNNAADPLQSVYENRPHMTTAKALMINTARPYDWTVPGPNDDIDRFKQGWGTPDLQRMHELRNRMLIVNETDVLTNLDSSFYSVTVDAGEPVLRATLVYADPPGLPAALMQRVNDLTLKVTSPSGVVYWGNNGLLDGMWSTPFGDPQDLDTVENVIVSDPEVGPWSIEVFAFELNEDGHVETPELDADYALVVSGVQESLPPFVLRLRSALPALVPPATVTELSVEIADGSESVVAGSPMLHYRSSDDQPFTTVPVEASGDGLYAVVIPGAPCDASPQFYLSATGSGGTTIVNPPTAPEATYRFTVGAIETVFEDAFEMPAGWTVVNEALTGGAWERGVPAGIGARGDPVTDFDGSGQCFLTENIDGNDVDGGPTRLLSPVFDIASVPDPEVRYARWFYNDDEDADRLLVEVAVDGGPWVTLESVEHDPGWIQSAFRLTDYVALGSSARLRFSTFDNPNDSVTEAAIDAVHVSSFVCENTVEGDATGDGIVGFQDILAVVSAWGPCSGACPTDVDGDGETNFLDMLIVLTHWMG